jgi:DNA modification methylase
MFRNVKHNHEEQTIHPCQFPEDMIARIILCTTEPGDVVLDPYMGTGTVAVVARDHGRQFIGLNLKSDTIKSRYVGFRANQMPMGDSRI